MLETILVFVVIPAAVYGLVGLVTLRSKFSRSERYRPGQEWNHAPVWWSANPEALTAPGAGSGAGADGSEASMSLGGARGSW